MTERESCGVRFPLSSCGGPCRRAFLKPFALAAQPCRLRLSGRCPMGRKSVFEPVASDGCMTDSFRRPCIGTKPDEKSQKPYSVKPLPFVSGRSFRSCEAAAGTDAIGGGAFCGPEPAACPSRRMPSLRKNGGGGLQRIPVFRILSGDRTLPDGCRTGPERSFDGTLSGGRPRCGLPSSGGGSTMRNRKPRQE